MGAQLKTLISQKTVIYSGYSLSDENYKKLLATIAKMMGLNTRHSYFVSPQIDQDKIKDSPIPLIPIETDGAYFFEQIRVHLENDLKIVPARAFEACESLLPLVRAEHVRAADAFSDKTHQLLVFALAYQDGLIHGLQRILDRRKSGEYNSFERLRNLVNGYILKIDEYKRQHDYWNSSYADGYGNAVLYLLCASSDLTLETPPIYGAHGRTPFNSLSSLLRYPRKRIMKQYASQAKRIIGRLKSGSEILIPDHTPYL
jgi:SIR2-like domain